MVHMRYVRTEDGIYEDAGTDALGLRCVRHNGEKITLSQDDDKIVKEADTIEELCDAFEILRDGEDVVLRGFIRTEKALIFVAKANEKGELELL